MQQPLVFPEQSNVNIVTHNNRPDLRVHRNFEALRQSIKHNRDYRVVNSGIKVVSFINL